MTGLIGSFSLSLAVLVALVTVLTAIAAVRFESNSMLRTARGMIGGFFVLITLASLALMIALASSDFRYEYVEHYTERALPLGYKLAAFWAGQEGSLLLWAWLLAGMSTIAAFTLPTMRSNFIPAVTPVNGDSKHRHSRKFANAAVLDYAPGTLRGSSKYAEPAAILATLAVVCGFFAALMLFAANPFKVGEVVAADGHGLNPMLQDPGMIAHPPMLFLGYAGFTVPFALLVGALVAGRKDNEWILATRRWALVSWLFLSIGILLGAQWAYVELGWGGYWAWDPVENASLLPWLTGTALLHSIVVQQYRGMFKKWNASLIAVTFILCIFGTYLTRSGVIDSVHSFGKSLIGTFFLVFLTLSTLFSAVIIAVGRKTLRSEQELEALSGKEGFFLATNVLLIGMTLITLIGTIFPIISRALSGQQVTVGPNFYNKVVAPLALLLTGLMAAGPLLIYGKDAARRLARGLIIPGTMAAVIVAVAIALGLRNIWALIAAAIVACGLAVILVDLSRSVLARMRSHDEDAIKAVLTLLDSNHRRYGGQIVHVGVLMIVVGVVGSSLFKHKQDLTLMPGQSVPFAGRTLTLVGVEPAKGVNYDGAAATLTLSSPNGVQTSLQPQIRRYDKAEQLNSEVSIRSNWREDVYVTLASVETTGAVTIQAMINPLVSWIWIGGIVLTFGGIVALVPRLQKELRTADCGLRIEGADKSEIRNPKSAMARKSAIATTIALALVMIASTSSAQTTQPAASSSGSLPAGHPDISQMLQSPSGTAGSAAMPGGVTLPAGHPDISKMMSKQPSTQPQAITGTLNVHAVQGTAGGPAVGADDVTVEFYVQGQLIDRVDGKLNAQGQLAVPGVPLNLHPQPVVRITHAGIEYSANGPVMDGSSAQMDLDVPVYEVSEQAPDWQVRMRHVMVQHADEDGLHVMEMLAVDNPTDRAWRGKPIAGGRHATFTLTLPSGAKDIQVGGGMLPDEALIEGNKITSTAPMGPGSTQYQIHYTLPIDDAKAAIAITAPVSVKHLMVFVPEDGSSVQAEGLEAGGSADLGTGKTRFYQATGVEAGKQIQVVISGITVQTSPQTAGIAQGTTHAAQIVAGAGALVILLFGIAFVFLKAPAKKA